MPSNLGIEVVAVEDGPRPAHYLKSPYQDFRSAERLSIAVLTIVATPL
jgi:hypothetical protein